jgi:pimeloyl-ACP methyl ester carboxylesterase
MRQTGDIAARFARVNGVKLAYRVRGEGPPLVMVDGRKRGPADMLEALSSSLDRFAKWPLAGVGIALGAMIFARQAWVMASRSRFGDGKPIILVQQYLGSDLGLLPMLIWLKALGYRPATAGLLLNLQDPSDERTLSRLIGEVTDRVGRKAVLVTHSTGLALALRAGRGQRGRVADIIVLAPPHGTTTTDDIRIHFICHLICHGWSMLHSMMELPWLLAKIGIELIEPSELSELEVAPGAPAEEEAK